MLSMDVMTDTEIQVLFVKHAATSSGELVISMYFKLDLTIYLHVQAMSKLRQRYDELKERYGVSDITVSVQSKDRSSNRLSFILSYN